MDCRIKLWCEEVIAATEAAAGRLERDLAETPAVDSFRRAVIRTAIAVQQMQIARIRNGCARLEGALALGRAPARAELDGLKQRLQAVQSAARTFDETDDRLMAANTLFLAAAAFLGVLDKLSYRESLA